MNRSIITALILAVSVVTGCTAAKPQPVSTVFYPSPPEPARIQFLTSFTGEQDIVEAKSAFQSFIVGSGGKARRLDKPYGVAIWKGRIYVCDTNQGVMVFDLEKRTFEELAGAPDAGKLTQPVNIRIAPDGMKYVSDPVREQVVVFGEHDEFKTAFGTPATWKPVDAVPYGDELFVVDMKNFDIVVLNRKDGSLLRRFGRTSSDATKLARPTNIAFDDAGNLYVSDIGRFQIVKFDREGHYLGVVGELGVESGTFARPKGIAIDRAKRLNVVDAAFANVQIFNQEGNLLFFFGSSGKRPGDLNLPAQIVVDYDNIRYFQRYVHANFEVEALLIVTSQFGDRMINVYALGREQGKNYLTDDEAMRVIKKRMEQTGQEKTEQPERRQ